MQVYLSIVVTPFFISLVNKKYAIIVKNKVSIINIIFLIVLIVFERNIETVNHHLKNKK